MTDKVTYRNRATGQTVEIKADFADAASRIEVRWDGRDWQATPCQVADAAHDRRKALLLVLGWDG